MDRDLSPAQPIRNCNNAYRIRGVDEESSPMFDGGRVRAGSGCSASADVVTKLSSGRTFCALLDYASSPHPTRAERALCDSVNEGLQRFQPRLADDGTGGVYFMHDNYGEKIAVFKPSDEEPGTPNNPRGLNSPSPSSPFLHSPLISMARPLSHPLPIVTRVPSISAPRTLPALHVVEGFAARDSGDVASKAADVSRTARAPPIEMTFFASNVVAASLPTPKLHTPSPLRLGPAAAPAVSLDVGAIDHRQRSGIPGGSAACREVAAYLLDHEHYANVPMTTLVVVQHEAFHSTDVAHAHDKKVKIGSLQSFVRHSLVADEQPLAVLRRVDVDELHRVAVLDIRLCNTDRHGGNMLLSESIDVGVEATRSGSGDGARVPTTRRPLLPERALSSSADGEPSSDKSDESDDEPSADDNVVGRLDESMESVDEPSSSSTSWASAALRRSGGRTGVLHVTPIDHGYTLPSNLEEVWFAWATWPQAKLPFSASTLAYIESLDWRADVATLRKFGGVFGDDTLVVLRLSTTLLQRAARRRLTPADIADLMCRKGDEPAPIERLVVCAHEARVAKFLALKSSTSSASPSPVSSSSPGAALTPLSSSPSAVPAATSSLSTSALTASASMTSATAVIASSSVDEEAFFATFERLLDEYLDVTKSIM